VKFDLGILPAYEILGDPLPVAYWCKGAVLYPKHFVAEVQEKYGVSCTVHELRYRQVRIVRESPGVFLLVALQSPQRDDLWITELVVMK